MKDEEEEERSTTKRQRKPTKKSAMYEYDDMNINENDAEEKKFVIEKTKKATTKTGDGSSGGNPHCCVCLHRQSDVNGFNELVECDSCGFYVHEGCYGICDTESKQSTNSAASTEPWFCNSCLVDDGLLMENLEQKQQQHPHNNSNEKKNRNFAKRMCELCPNVECGLLKETETSK
jgi:hypothetical protein